MSTVLTDLDAGVLTITFNRPERNNGWMAELENDFFEALMDASRQPEVRVVIVTGAGRAFCPGLDMITLAESAHQGKPMSTERRYPMNLARLVPKPVIAAVNGACAGIGLIQASCADMRFAARGAKFTTAFARRGLPAENSLSWVLPRIIGTAHAMDLLLSGRVITADEALSMGLVNRVYEPEELLPATLEYAKDMAANCSPASMAAIKEQILLDWERDWEQSRHRALEIVSQFTLGADFAEGVASYTEKRPPQFQGLSREPAVGKYWIR